MSESSEAHRTIATSAAKRLAEIRRDYTASLYDNVIGQDVAFLLDQLTAAQAEIDQLKAHNESMMDTIVEFTKDESVQLRDAKVLLERAQVEIERLQRLA